MKFNVFGLGVRNVSDSWRAAAQTRLSADLTAGTFAGVHVGEEIGRLSFLGRSDLHSRRDREYRYSRLGLSIVYSEGRFQDILLAVSKLKTLRPYRGEWFVEGKSIRIGPETTAEEMRNLLQAPIDQWNDGVELAMRFQSKDAVVEFSWHCESGSLRYVFMEAAGQAGRPSQRGHD